MVFSCHHYHEYLYPTVVYKVTQKIIVCTNEVGTQSKILNIVFRITRVKNDRLASLLRLLYFSYARRQLNIGIHLHDRIDKRLRYLALPHHLTIN
jgi:hypothetical protein